MGNQEKEIGDKMLLMQDRVLGETVSLKFKTRENNFSEI